MVNQDYKIDYGRIAGSFGDTGGSIVLGIDGFIDEVWQIIASRASSDEYKLYERMLDFSETLVKCDEGGFSNEIIRKRRSYGGFTANTSKAVSRLGIPVTMLGMFGQNGVDQVFAGFSGTNRLISVGAPGICQIYEFSDGKLMLPYIQEVMGFNWKSLTSAVDESELKALFMDADLIALGYWSLMPAFNEIVAGICRLIWDSDKKQRMFFDFADIRKRDRQSLESTLQHLAAADKQVPMTLSLNEHEAALLFSYYGETLVEEITGAGAQTEKIRNIIGLDELVVHTPYFAAAASAPEGYVAVPQHYCTSPVITTGAGDNFNGGYLASYLKGLNMAERLAVANAVTYQYVSLGHSPDKDEMLAELADRWR